MEKITRTALLNLANKLATLADKDLGNVKVSYAISRTIKAISSEVSTIESLKEKVTTDFETARTTICEQFCDKNEDGTPKIENDNYCGIPNPEFTDALQVLIAEHQPRIEEFNEFLKEDVEVDLFKLDVELLPSNTTALDLITLEPILK
jgi:hypothetical protein